MDIATATGVVSVVVVFVNGAGAILNNRRYTDLRLLVEEKLGEVRERLRAVEIKQDRAATVERNGRR